MSVDTNPSHEQPQTVKQRLFTLLVPSSAGSNALSVFDEIQGLVGKVSQELEGLHVQINTEQRLLSLQYTEDQTPLAGEMYLDGQANGVRTIVKRQVRFNSGGFITEIRDERPSGSFFPSTRLAYEYEEESEAETKRILVKEERGFLYDSSQPSQEVEVSHTKRGQQPEYYGGNEALFNMLLVTLNPPYPGEIKDSSAAAGFLMQDTRPFFRFSGVLRDDRGETFTLLRYDIEAGVPGAIAIEMQNGQVTRIRIYHQMIQEGLAIWHVERTLYYDYEDRQVVRKTVTFGPEETLFFSDKYLAEPNPQMPMGIDRFYIDRTIPNKADPETFHFTELITRIDLGIPLGYNTFGVRFTDTGNKNVGDIFTRTVEAPWFNGRLILRIQIVEQESKEGRKTRIPLLLETRLE